MDDRRMFERIKTKLSLKFSANGNTKQGEAETTDISGNGMGFVTKETHSLSDASLEISLLVPDYHEPLCLKDRVVWLSKVEGGKGQRVGVHLEEERLMNVAQALWKKKGG